MLALSLRQAWCKQGTSLAWAAQRMHCTHHLHGSRVPGLLPQSLHLQSINRSVHTPLPCSPFHLRHTSLLTLDQASRCGCRALKQVSTADLLQEPATQQDTQGTQTGTSPQPEDDPVTAISKELQDSCGIVLRDYQEDTLLDVLNNIEEGLNRQLIALPTGSGKTVVFLTLARMLNLKTLILANSNELIWQTEDMLNRIWPGVESGVMQGGKKNNVVDRQLVIATVQTASQTKRLQALREQDWQLLIVDEAHHAVANTYIQVMLNLNFLSVSDANSISDREWVRYSEEDVWNLNLIEEEAEEASKSTSRSSKRRRRRSRSRSREGDVSQQNAGEESHSVSSSSSLEKISVENKSSSVSRNTDSSTDSSVSSSPSSFADSAETEGSTKIILGCTATPFRRGPDELNLVFETLVQSVTLGDLISKGYLCKVFAERVLTYTDISSALSGTGELSDGAELSQAIDTPERNQLVVTAYCEKAAGRKAVAFCSSLDHAANLAQAFKDKNISSCVVSSRNSKQERAEILEAHRQGDIQVLTNVGVLTEGYDDTSISAILMTKPTTSTGLYTQCVGRGLRTHPGKEDCILLDFTDRLHSLDHESDLVTSQDLFDGEEGAVLLNYVPADRDNVRKELRMIMGGQFDLYQSQKFFWVPRFREFWMSILPASPYRRGQAPQRSAPGQQGNVWIHLREIPAPKAPAGTVSKQRRKLNYELRMSTPSFSPPLAMPRAWVQLGSFYDIPASGFPSKVLKLAESCLRVNSELVPNLKSMKLARWNAKVGWPSEPASDKQKALLASKKWLPEDGDIQRVTKGQAAAAITLMKVEEAEGARKRRDKDAVVLPATEKQKAFLRVLLEEHGSSPSVVVALADAGLQSLQQAGGVESLSKMDASVSINLIKMHKKDSFY